MAQTSLSELVRYVRGLTGEIAGRAIGAPPAIHLHLHMASDASKTGGSDSPPPVSNSATVRDLAEKMTTHLWRLRRVLDELERVAGADGRLTDMAVSWRKEADADERLLLETLLTLK
jgi:hypothetical protein